MRESHLLRSRKVIINPPLESPPEKFEIRPIVKKKSVITGLQIFEPTAKIIQKRKDIKQKIKEEYPQVTSSQLDDAEFTYYDYHVDIKLRQFSDAPN